MAEHSVPKAMTLDEIDSESSKDEMLGKIRQCIKTNKRPAHDKALTPYFKIRAELSLHGNLLLRGSKLVHLINHGNVCCQYYMKRTKVFSL